MLIEEITDCLAKKVESWRYYGKQNSYMVEIVRSNYLKRDLEDEARNGAKNTWNIYTYIYYNHPLFKEFASLVSAGDTFLNFHGGCNYMRKHRNDAGEIVSVQLGCDFNHLHDDERYYETLEEVPTVEFNAVQLYKRLAHDKQS